MCSIIGRTDRVRFASRSDLSIAPDYGNLGRAMRFCLRNPLALDKDAAIDASQVSSQYRS